MEISRKKALTPVIIVVIIITGIFLAMQGFKREIRDSEENSGGLKTNSPILVKLPDSVRFAGERMPLEYFDTRESLEREIIITAYRHSSTIMIIKRSARYFPIIEKILKEYNIPDDFKYLAAAESDLSNLVSPKGATGFWQIMPESGKEEGMEINNEVDERYNLEKSTKFACEYFLKSYAKYGNWTLSAASYNGGRNGIDDQIEIQHEKNYYDLLLADETARYIFRAVAYKLIISDPAAYGFKLDKSELYPGLNYKNVKIDTAVTDFADFARKFNTNYKILKLLNPWLRKPYLTNKSGKSYTLMIPGEGFRIGDQAGFDK
jgi:membrane-bound lytic murein transglycosylase D